MIRIQLFGGLTVRGDDGRPLDGAAVQPRRLAVLALVARAGERGIARERLLSLLWPNADGERGPKALTQALYAIRKDLGVDDAVVGARELRFDPALVTSDLAEFSAAMARGDDTRAVACYSGPFLDGFQLAGADGFQRWAEQERNALTQEYGRALEGLARATTLRGDHQAAVGWWQKLAALDPLSARVTVGLMEAIARSGEVAQAVQQARVYELLMEQELDLAPDREVMALAERMRRGEWRAPESGVAVAEQRVAIAHPVVAVANERNVAAPPPLVAEPPTLTPVSAPPTSRRRLPFGGMLAGALLLIVVAGLFVARRPSATVDGTPGSRIIAIGEIVAFAPDSSRAGLAAAAADLLTSALARVPGLQVVSHGRVLELMKRDGTPGDTGAARVVEASRAGGATEVIDGSIFQQPDGHLRLDLRRVSLTTGAISAVHTVQGVDLFALIDSGAARLVAGLGAVTPAGSVADVTTASLAAYRLYEEGVRNFYQGDRNAAIRLFDAALGEDSLFAMAAYYGMLASMEADPRSSLTRFERARRLAGRATDRERLTILAHWAYAVSSPSLLQLADSLVTRYPNETAGPLYRGIAMVFDGDFLGGAAALERVVQMDSVGLDRARAQCNACEALAWRVSAYVLADSLGQAEREARRWLTLQPASLVAAERLVDVLQRKRAWATARETYDSLVGPRLPTEQDREFRLRDALVRGDYGPVDSATRAILARGKADAQVESWWIRSLALRERGRLVEALEAARTLTAIDRREHPDGANPSSLGVLEAQLLVETGQAAQGARLFEAIARAAGAGDAPSQAAGRSAWHYTLAASAWAIAGDTIAVARLTDSVGVFGAKSANGRDRRLVHHLRGLLAESRADDATAVREFRSAIYSMTEGYVRTNEELARVLLRLNRASEAVPLLQASVRGNVEASALYRNRTESEALLAEAFARSGARDSARVHYQIVATRWMGGDPAYRQRAVDAARQVATLGGTGR